MKIKKQAMRQSMISKFGLCVLVFTSLLTISCEDKKNNSDDVTTSTTKKETKYDAVSNEVLEDYINLKDALVETDSEKASTASEQLLSSLEQFDLDSQSAKLSASVVSATEHAKAMVGSDIDKQREAFLLLSANIIEIIEMTGTNTKLYQQHCPMYGEEGGTWLSTEEEIRNPYFGSEMMSCGEVQKEIN